MQYASMKMRDPETAGVARPVMIVGEAIDTDKEEDKEVETEHAPKAEAAGKEGGRVGNMPDPTTLQYCYTEIRKI